MPRCTAEVRTQRKPSEHCVHSLHIPPEPDTFNCHHWMRETATPPSHPTPLHLWGRPLSAPPSPRSLGFSLRPRPAAQGHQSALGSRARAGGGGNHQQRMAHSWREGGGQRGSRSGRGRLLTTTQRPNQQLQTPRSKDGFVLCGRKNALI